jgi:hypothetical protein
MISPPLIRPGMFLLNSRLDMLRENDSVWDVVLKMNLH